LGLAQYFLPQAGPIRGSVACILFRFPICQEKLTLRAKSNTMQATIQYIEKELSGYYPVGEIIGFEQLIYEKLFGLGYTDLFLRRESKLDERKKKEVVHIIQRLKLYEPIQYIFGETEFYGLALQVNPSVLIPRPETEELVDWIINSCTVSAPKILDIGTGSGCIALSLKKALPAAHVFATDISDETLKTAKENAKMNQLDVVFFQADILNFQHGKLPNFDLIVSNPPYVRELEKKQMQPNVLGWEPAKALFVSDDDPLVFYRHITAFANANLKNNGLLFFELNEKFGKETARLCEDFDFVDVNIRNDIHGKQRMLRCRKKV